MQRVRQAAWAGAPWPKLSQLDGTNGFRLDGIDEL